MKLSASGVGNMPLTSVPRLRMSAEGQVTQLGVAWSCRVVGNVERNLAQDCLQLKGYFPSTIFLWPGSANPAPVKNQPHSSSCFSLSWGMQSEWQQEGVGGMVWLAWPPRGLNFYIAKHENFTFLSQSLQIGQVKTAASS